MLATFVIGLREGLEAALIVGIIAAFLRKNGKSLIPMWIGVILAVIISVGIGVALKLVERELPQAEQEALETVIGAVAIVFVTGMIVWMNTHSRGMKRELEASAAEALSHGGAQSLAVMAFLAVLKEGFETSVFLLATFSAAESARLAAAGAVIGVLVAAIIGWGIYAGGVKINLGKFFRVTGAFLILVAAGLTVSMLRTAHEAGWLNAGQQRTVDLSWLVQPGTVRSALITGVLGIPADPRLIEVIGWFAYIIPVALYVYWPAKHRPKGMAVVRLQFGIASALAGVAIVMALAFPVPTPSAQGPAALVSSADAAATQQIGTAALDGDTLTVTIDGADPIAFRLTDGTSTQDTHNGIAAMAWTVQNTTSGESETVTLDELVQLAGGRIPIGISPQDEPGPFTLKRSTVATATIWVSHGILIDATETAKTIATLSEGGLTTPRTITLPSTASTNWAVAPDDAERIASELSDLEITKTERQLWGVFLPIVLGLAAILVATAGVRTLLRLRRAPPAPAVEPPPSRSIPEAPAGIPGPEIRYTHSHEGNAR
ncbi:MAG: FTR1 family protein [Thermomicrobiales bacterium]